MTCFGNFCSVRYPEFLRSTHGYTEKRKSLHCSDFPHNLQGRTVLEGKPNTAPWEGRGRIKNDWSESSSLPCWEVPIPGTLPVCRDSFHTPYWATLCARCCRLKYHIILQVRKLRLWVAKITQQVMQLRFESKRSDYREAIIEIWLKCCPYSQGDYNQARRTDNTYIHTYRMVLEVSNTESWGKIMRTWTSDG